MRRAPPNVPVGPGLFRQVIWGGVALAAMVGLLAADGSEKTQTRQSLGVALPPRGAPAAPRIAPAEQAAYPATESAESPEPESPGADVPAAPAAADALPKPAASRAATPTPAQVRKLLEDSRIRSGAPDGAD